MRNKTNYGKRTEGLLEAIDKIYDAAVDETKWSKCIESIATIFSCSLVTLVTEFGHHDSVSHHLRNEYHYSGSSELKVNQSELYPQLKAKVHFNELGSASLSIYRSRNGEMFQSDEHLAFQEVCSHLQRALLIAERLRAENAELVPTSIAADRLAFGIVVLNQSLRVIFSNQVATLILQSTHGVRLCNDRVVATKREDDQKLQRLLLEAASAKTGKDKTVMISRLPQQSLMVKILSYKSHESFEFVNNEASVMLLLQNAEGKREIDKDIISNLYGLPEAEARITTALVNGKTISQICESMQITRNTAKTLLRRIFLRLGARSQSDLVRIILCGLAQIGSNLRIE